MAKFYFVNIVENNWQINIQAHRIKAVNATEAVKDVLFRIYGRLETLKDCINKFTDKHLDKDALETRIGRHVEIDKINIEIVNIYEKGTPCYGMPDTMDYPEIRHCITAFVEN